MGLRRHRQPSNTTDRLKALDPFTGSGTTGMACRYEQRAFIGVEREVEYLQIAERRIAAVAPLFGEVAERVDALAERA